MASQSRNNKILLDLVQQPGNNLCADCAAPEPDWASYTLGVFVCLNCSGMHRNLFTVSKVKSIRLDYWEDSLVQFMKERGNSAARAIFEKCVPAFYYRPQHHDCIVLKEQWIRAKYERREFTGEKNEFLQNYTLDLFESTLWKKGRDNKQYLRRIFLLSQKDFTLRYFTKEDSKVAKAVISMKDLNAHFQPEKIGHAHGLQISYLEDERTRNLFVYHENGQLIPQITTHCLMEGYMEKTGPTQREPFKKRWFTLCSVTRKLLYFKSPLDATDLGAVFIGSHDHGYSVSESSGRCTRSGRWRCGITLETPSRQFVFMCEQEQERRQWMEAFRKVILQPMTPEDYANEATLRRGK
ncbi:arf-GAP with dual PH domain-containing protein 2-like isoform 3-T3 [Fundulus diaphanus]